MQTLNRAPRLVLRSALPPLQHAATAAQLLPAFEFTFISDGKTFKALQRGRNLQAAQAEAMLELSYQCADFNFQEARLVAAVQVQ